MFFLRPEDRNNIHFKEESLLGYYDAIRVKRAKFRFIDYMYKKIVVPEKADELLYIYSQRSNHMKVLALSMLGFYIGTILFYFNYKVNIIERKWVENYG
jgi:hypothetical protein